MDNEHMNDSDNGKEKELVNAIEVREKTTLSDPEIGDNDLIKFSSLNMTSKPIKELPPDNIDFEYTQNFEARCQLCKSPFRDLAEHVYLESCKKTSAVVNFFEEYFGAKITWTAVDNHMKYHCDFKKVNVSGLNYLINRGDNAAYWEYREMDLAIIGILAEIDDLRGLNLDGKPELIMKRTAQLERLYKDLIEYRKIRDEAATNAVSVFTILKELYDEMKYNEDKEIIIEKVKKIKNILSSAPNEE